MRHILKRNLVRDPSGRALSVESERLTDDERGSIQVTTERTAARCTGCRSPVADPAELRGLCDWCRVRGCCTHCLSRCELCSRRLCGQCRRGFAGPPPLTVCPVCQQRLFQRQLLQDRQAAFERELARHRLYTQDQALRLEYQRTYLTAQIQAARVGLRLVPGRPRLIVRVFRRIGSAAAKVVQHARRALP